MPITGYNPKILVITLPLKRIINGSGARKIAGRLTKNPARKKYIGVKNPIVNVRKRRMKNSSRATLEARTIPSMYAGSTASLPDHNANAPSAKRTNKIHLVLIAAVR
jgi:hypothetical protein